MRVLYLCLDRGIEVGGSKGAAIHVSEMTDALRAEGHSTLLLARRGSASEHVTIAPVPSGHVTGPAALVRRDLREVLIGRRLRREIDNVIRRFQPEFVYERHALFRSEGVAAAAVAGVPHVLEVNAPLADEESRFRGLALARRARNIERRAWSTTDLAVVPSHRLASIVGAAGARQVLVVPNAVDPEVFAPRGRRAELRHRHRLDDTFVVGFAGSLKFWHDMGTVVDAVAVLGARIELPVALLVVGDGPARSELVARSADRNIRLVLTGAVPHEDVPACIEAMDVCVTPLTADPTLQYFSPLKALEYLAMGRPTVVAAAGDLATLINEDVVVGYRPGDADELASCLAAIACDEAAAASRAARGRDYAGKHTWSAAARTIVQAVASIRSTESSE